MWTWYDREVAELIWQETLEMMTDAEIAEMERRQQAERETDYFGQWPTIDDLDEVLEVIKDGY